MAEAAVECPETHHHVHNNDESNSDRLSCFHRKAIFFI